MRRVLLTPPHLLHEAQSVVLKRRSFSVLECHDPKEVLVVSKALRPDLIMFADAAAEMSPEEFCDAIRWEFSLRRPKLLFLGASLGAVRHHAIGADAWLAPPFTGEALSRVIAHLLGEPSRAAQRVNIALLANVVGIANSGRQEDSNMVNIVNLSETGARFESQAQIEVDGRGLVKFHLPGAKQRLHLDYVVRNRVEDRTPRYGVEFRNLRALDCLALRSFVHRRTDRVH